MMDDVRDWLPRAAYTDREILACARGVVGAWCASWFAGPTATIAFARDAETDAASAEDPPISFHGRFSYASLVDSGATILLEAALGSALPKKLTVHDSNVMHLFAERVVSDLVAHFEDAFGPRAASDGERVALCVNVIARDEVAAAVVLDLPRVAFAGPLKQQWGRSARQKDVATLRAALAPMPMRLEVLVGRAQLTMGDVRAMAPGDVLVLDRALEDRVDVVVAGGNASIGRGKFGFDGEHATVEL